MSKEITHIYRNRKKDVIQWEYYVINILNNMSFISDDWYILTTCLISIVDAQICQANTGIK